MKNRTLGTRFGVSVEKTGGTDVAVFQGKVQVYGSKAGPVLATLTEGRAVTVHPSATVRRLARITTMGDSLPLMIPPPPGSLVTDVSDNVAESGRYAFYDVQPRGMKAGTRPYSTLGMPRWRPLPGQTFPAELLGADVVRTFSPDRKDPNLEVTITVARPCVVYVMMDPRVPTPDWVKQDFSDTGYQLRSGPWPDNAVVRGLAPDSDGEIFVTYQVWKKTQPTAGVVKLGPVSSSGKGRKRAMYGVAVQSRKR